MRVVASLRRGALTLRRPAVAAGAAIVAGAALASGAAIGAGGKGSFDASRGTLTGRIIEAGEELLPVAFVIIGDEVWMRPAYEELRRASCGGTRSTPGRPRRSSRRRTSPSSPTPKTSRRSARS